MVLMFGQPKFFKQLQRSTGLCLCLREAFMQKQSGGGEDIASLKRGGGGEKGLQLGKPWKECTFVCGGQIHRTRARANK